MSSENTVEAAVEPADKEVTKTPTQDILQAENDKEKSGDKREIEDEEREKMLNEENKKELGEVEKKKKALEEAEREKEGTKRRIPTGGIKIPGFLRSRSRDKNKEGDADGDEGADLLEPPCTATTVGSDDDKADTPTTKSRTTKFKFSNPFAKKKKQESVQSEGEPEAGGDSDIPLEKRPGFINAIKLPLVSVIPRKLRSTKDRDSEDGSGGDGGGGGGAPAGLASMETLEDSNGSHKNVDDKTDEGLETVKLDSSTDEKIVLDLEKAAAMEEEKDKNWNKQLWSKRLQLLNEHKVATIGVVIFLILLIAIIIVAASGSRPVPTAPVIDGRYTKAATSCGYVEGILEDGGVVFRGIPYALPPVGNLRWAPPQELNSLGNCWNGTLKAHNSSAACWQIYSNGTLDGSEDCLYLDIVTPYVRYESPVPVVVLFGSESLTGGSPGVLDLPLPRLSRSREVVFVRPNFRLGVLGFLAAAPLSRATHPPTSGNYGLLDAIAALKWIKINIQNFGGDSSSITLLGHRAGATLVTALTASKKASDLFKQAWVSSGSANYPGLPLMESERDTEHQYLMAFGSDKEIDADFLRKQDVEDLLDNVPDEWRRDTPDLPDRNEENKTKHHWMVLDGAVLQEHPLEVWGKMNISSRLVIGTTAHSEATRSLKSQKTEWLAEDVARHVRESRLQSLGLAEEALRRYGATFKGLAAMISDIRTVCPLLTLARKIPHTPFYVVKQERNNGLADVDSDVAAILGRYEAKSPEQRRYVTAIQQIFYRYVALHKFDSPAADAGNNKILIIGQDPSLIPDYPNCDFWISKDIVPRYSRVD